MRIIARSAHARRIAHAPGHALAPRGTGAELLFGARFGAPFCHCAGIAFFSLCLSALPACFSSKGTIGAVIAQDGDSGRLFLREVPPDLAAGRANLKPGDEILLIDGLDVRRMDPQQINAALTGEVDSPVKLTLIREEQVLRVTLRRSEAHRLAKKPGKSAGSGS